jgi:signal transduction histidine kinase
VSIVLSADRLRRKRLFLGIGFGLMVLLLVGSSIAMLLLARGIKLDIEAVLGAQTGAVLDTRTHWFVGWSVIVIGFALGTAIVIYAVVFHDLRNYITGILQVNQQNEIVQRSLEERQRLVEELILDLSSTEEEQRKRFSRELHDAIGHGLTSVKFHIDSARSDFARDVDRASWHLRSADEIVRQTLTEARRIAYELRPSVLDDFGLLAAIEQLAVDFQRRTGMNVHADIPDALHRSSPVVEISIYRIIQEAFTNIEKHSRASNVALQLLERDEGVLALSINDDGQGFRVEDAVEDGRPHFGLRNLRERVKLLNGIIEIDSAPGQGTEISIELPASDGKGSA